jgi:hypothetical protein
MAGVCLEADDLGTKFEACSGDLVKICSQDGSSALQANKGTGGACGGRINMIERPWFYHIGIAAENDEFRRQISTQ